MGASVCYPEEANEAMVTVEKEAKKAVDMVQALANGGETVEASENLWPCVNTLLIESTPTPESGCFLFECSLYLFWIF